jgi:hypothetical protein
MINKFAIPFSFCIALLIVSEYFLLKELYAHQRISIVFLCSVGLLTGIVFFWLAFKKYSNSKI